jgi:type IV pilus assembly protein PilC
MPEFRYHGKGVSGHVIQGVLNAGNQREAKKRAEEFCGRQRVKLDRLDRRVTYLYKVQRGSDKPIQGEQVAFSKEEVEAGLRKLNYRVIRVQKKLLDFNLKPPAKDIMLFIRLCADLLRERLSYDEILTLMANDTENKTLAKTIREIQQGLKEGKDGPEVFGRHVDIFGRFTSYMLSVASTSGNMAEVYDSTAKFLERDEEFKKNLKSALITPMVILVALFGAVIYYVIDIFPATAELFQKFDIDLEEQAPKTYATLQLSDFLQENYFWLILAFLVPVIALGFAFRTPRGRYIRDRLVWMIPVIGGLLHKTSIEIFARVFYALYSGSGENIAVIRVAAEACRNTYMEQQIKEVAIPMMLKEGHGLVESLERSGVFTTTAISRFRSGQESGSLRSTVLQLASYYERETTYKMKNVVELVNVLISMIIMVVMAALTLVSSETATIKIPTPGAG